MSEKHALKSGREACYKARDAFYQCVRASGAAFVEGQPIPPSCQRLRKAYESSCLPSWVSGWSCAARPAAPAPTQTIIFRAGSQLGSCSDSRGCSSSLPGPALKWVAPDLHP